MKTILSERNIVIVNAENLKVVTNKTVIVHVREYIKNMNNKLKILAKINYVRLWKKVILLC